MSLIRNRAVLDLQVAGRVYPAGEVVDVPADLAGVLCANPNFEPVTAPAGTAGKAGDEPAPKPSETARRRARKKD